MGSCDGSVTGLPETGPAPFGSSLRPAAVLCGIVETADEAGLPTTGLPDIGLGSVGPVPRPAPEVLLCALVKVEDGSVFVEEEMATCEERELCEVTANCEELGDFDELAVADEILEDADSAGEPMTRPLVNDANAKVQRSVRALEVPEQYIMKRM